MYEMVYSLTLEDVHVDARVEMPLALSTLKEKLKEVPVTGLADTSYDAFVFEDNEATLVRKGDLCTVVFNDIVPLKHQTNVAAAIQLAWMQMFPGMGSL